jgi:hypothetical protein
MGGDVEGATSRQHFANYVVSTPLVGLCDTALACNGGHTATEGGFSCVIWH